MGLIISRIFDRFLGPTSKRIVLIGLDNAGKTTILYKLHLGEIVHSIPTVGFNVETIAYKNIEMTCWDIGGQKKIRGLWHHYYNDTDAVIFVVDSNDPDRLMEAHEELTHVMNNDALSNAALLVYANKQDLPNALGPSVIMEKLGLNTQFKDRKWHVQGTVGANGAGLYEGLDWLADVLTKK